MARNNYEVDKYQNEWGIWCNKSRCFVAFGKKKNLKQRVKELNNSLVESFKN